MICGTANPFPIFGLHPRLAVRGTRHINHGFKNNTPSSKVSKNPIPNCYFTNGYPSSARKYFRVRSCYTTTRVTAISRQTPSKRQHVVPRRIYPRLSGASITMCRQGIQHSQHRNIFGLNSRSKALVDRGPINTRIKTDPSFPCESPISHHPADRHFVLFALIEFPFHIGDEATHEEILVAHQFSGQGDCIVGPETPNSSPSPKCSGKVFPSQTAQGCTEVFEGYPTSGGICQLPVAVSLSPFFYSTF